MKSIKWKWAAAMLTLGAMNAPAQAQPGGFDGINFIKAVRERDGDAAIPLLTSRPNVVNARDPGGDTALTVAIARRDDMWTFFLLSKGANPSLEGRNGDTPLIVAARVGYLEAAEQLIARKAKVDQANRRGETPLIVAVQQRQRDIVQLLLDEGADPDKTDNAAGFSARDYAKRDMRSREILAMIETAKAGQSPVKKVEKADDFKL
jgi:ankyrin repeat protein